MRRVDVRGELADGPSTGRRLRSAKENGPRDRCRARRPPWISTQAAGRRGPRQGRLQASRARRLRARPQISCRGALLQHRFPRSSTSGRFPPSVKRACSDVFKPYSGAVEQIRPLQAQAWATGEFLLCFAESQPDPAQALLSPLSITRVWPRRTRSASRGDG
jgi:hypothetical protein